MKRIVLFLERNALALAMLVGVAGFPIFRHMTGLLPPMIFLMLFFTFCKINPADLRLRKWHWIVLGVQLVLGIAIYYILDYGLKLTSTLSSKDIAK